MTPSQGIDYRESHLAQGPEYENMLENRPWPRYQALREAEILSLLVTRLFPNKRVRHLDFACGTGRILKCLEPHVYSSTGVDVSPKMAELARAKCPNAQYLIQDITKHPISGATYDLITAFRFFGNAQDDLRSAVLRELTALLNTDGVIIINNHRNPLTIRYKLRKMARLAPEVDKNPFNRLDLTHKKLSRLLAENSLYISMAIPVGFWVLRAKWQEAIGNKPLIGRALDSLFRFQCLAQYSPDAVLVCRKR